MTPEEIAALKAEHEKTKKELDELKAKGTKTDPPNPNPNQDDKDKDLYEKFKKDQADNEKNKGNSKLVENAVKFDYGLNDFIKNHKDILPSDMENIVKAAQKENFDSMTEKSNAIKSGFIQSFFSIQANMDLLTGSHKQAVEDFLKLTKKGKEDKASDIYDNVFEPTIETIKRVKKADEIAKAKYGGLGSSSSGEIKYLDKLKSASQKAHLNK
jgi:hypothetical protein